MTAIALTLSGQAMAQMTPKGTPPAPAGQPVNPPAGATPSDQATAPSANTAGKSANATAPANLTVGLAVKDKTGAGIGQITDLKPDASGAQMATIKMSTGSFTVAASSLAVQDGAASINLTKADIDKMIAKPGG
jgi:hypothetical protein